MKFNAISNLNDEMMRGKMKSWRQWQIGTTLNLSRGAFVFVLFCFFFFDILNISLGRIYACRLNTFGLPIFTDYLS